VKSFQGKNELSVDGDAGVKTREALFRAYMNWLRTPQNGAYFSMEPSAFLGGAGANLGDLPKMSLQSCGKFNPIVLLTNKEMTGSDQTTRNDDDAPNRRVMMFFFKKGTTVDESVWPCPKVKESNAACSAAFWPDGDARRKNGDVQREYKTTHDTMACRFYDRFARRSPCERELKPSLWIRCHDDADNLLTSGFCQVQAGGSTLATVAIDPQGWARVPLTGAVCYSEVDVAWGSGSKTGPFPFSGQLYLSCFGDEGAEQDKRRLNNLGYDVSDLEFAVKRFQTNYLIVDGAGNAEVGLTADNQLPEFTQKRLKEIYEAKNCNAEKTKS
jgi:hypothetical protein